MTHETRIYPGKDERSQGQGFSAAELMFIVKDYDCALTFSVSTNWLPPTVPSSYHASLRPLDTTFHFPDPTLTAVQDRRDTCGFIKGACHSISSTKHGERLLSVLLSEGSAGLYVKLERLLREEANINRPRYQR